MLCAHRALSITRCPRQKKAQLVNALFGPAEQWAFHRRSPVPGHVGRRAENESRCGYLHLVELRQLEAFVAVATELHFGRAADRLHIAAPTLSELIRRLERELGTPLLTRTTRRVALTSAGAELLSRSKVILDEVARRRPPCTASPAARRAPCGSVSRRPSRRYLPRT